MVGTDKTILKGDVNMKYFRVKPEYDCKPRFYEKPNHQLRQDGALVGGELYTPTERAKIMNGAWMFEEVDISRKRTYWFFGARFEYGVGMTG